MNACFFKFFKPLLQGTIFTLPVAIAFMDCVAYVAKVEGVSMQPVLNPTPTINDYVVLNKWSAKQFDVARGDIVALKSPRDPRQKLIKRVIGLEGDVIRTLSYKKRFVEIPEGHCWVEGDHHNHSLDSNQFGPISLGLITAKATHIIWPLGRLQKLTPDLPNDRKPVPQNVNVVHIEVMVE